MTVQGSVRAEIPLEMTVEEWAAMEEDEPGELVDGRLAEEEVPDLTHESAVVWLIRVLSAWLAPRGGFVFGSEAKFRLGPRQGRKPDVTAFFAGRRLPKRGAVSVPPDIAIEVVSPDVRDGRRDRIEKMADYSAFGIRQYWLVDPMLRTLEIFSLGANGKYVCELGASEGVVGAVPGCNGLSLDLDELWREIDRLEDESE
jgi:Uma2 family endonuclease